jgi:hypothetical protein
MRSRYSLIASTAIFLSIGMLYAGKKHENWMDEPFTKWDPKQVAELFNKSAWAVAKSFRGQVNGAHGTVADVGSQTSTGAVGTGGAGVSAPSASQSPEDVSGAGGMGAGSSANTGGIGTSTPTGGVDVPEFTFTARLFSAQPMREAYVRMLQIMNHYEAMPAARQRAFDQKMAGILHYDASQKVVVMLAYQTNDPNSKRDMDQWFNTQSTGSLKQNAYLFSPSAGQLELVQYFPPSQNGGLGAQFIFPRNFKGEPILQPGAGKMRFQLSYQPQINQTMYIDFDPKGMTYKDQFSY